MLCILTHRRLKPGTLDRFRHAWEPDREVMPEEMRGDRAYVVRSLGDENEIITFHLSNLTQDDLMRLRESLTKELGQREQTMAEFVEWTGVSGIFEVVDELKI
jgi:hypothetical protein